MPLQEIECMGVPLDFALQVCLEHEGVGALGGGEGPSWVIGEPIDASRRLAQPLAVVERSDTTG